MSTNLKKYFLSSIKWAGLSSFGVQSIQSLTTVVLAWFLSPKEFGIIGIAKLQSGRSNLKKRDYFVAKRVTAKHLL